VEADQTQLSQTRAAYWNNYLIFSYIGVDGKRHRLLFHSIYRRWRNDDIDAQSLLLEVDTNSLLFGSSNGCVNIDRQDQAFDESYVTEGFNTVLTQVPISMTLQTPFSDQGLPAVQKNYIHCLIDCDTGGAEITITLFFNDGEESLVLGTITTTERQRINLPINDGLGVQAYKVSVQISGAVEAQTYIYQAGIQYVSLAITRRDFDSYWLSFSDAESKVLKQVFWDYQATAPVNFSVYYDGAETPAFTFVLESTNGSRNVQRVRLPAVNFRNIRFTAYSSEDFMLWPESRAEYKIIPAGKGYMVQPFMG